MKKKDINTTSYRVSRWLTLNETRRNYMIVSLSHAEANLDDATRRRDVHEQEYATETARIG